MPGYITNLLDCLHNEKIRKPVEAPLTWYKPTYYGDTQQTYISQDTSTFLMTIAAILLQSTVASLVLDTRAVDLFILPSLNKISTQYVYPTITTK